MRKVAIIGVGQTPFSKNSPLSIRELAFEAYAEAVRDSEISTTSINASLVCSAPEYDKQRSPGGVIAEYLGLNPQPVIHIENLCASGSAGLRIGYGLIASGLHEVVCIIGFQKMSELTAADCQERMARGADLLWETQFGTSMPASYALYAQRHFSQYGTSEEDLANIRIKASVYGADNEKALFRRKLTNESILSSPYVATPLKVYDCCSNADGATCIILACQDRAHDFKQRPIWISGLGMATLPVNLSARPDFTGFDSVKKAAEIAYNMAGVNASDIDVAQVHDCFTIAELMAYEDLGFAEKGEGVTLVQSKATNHGGKIPVNLDGGLLAKGHAIGATGGSQIRSIVLQLRQQAGLYQVHGASTGLVHNVGGAGVYGFVTILVRND